MGLLGILNETEAPVQQEYGMEEGWLPLLVGAI